MSPRVLLPGPLRALADGRTEVEVDAGTVGHALDQLVERFPPLRRHLFDERGRLRGYVNVYLNDESVSDTDGRAADADIISIIPSIAGGDVPADDDDDAAIARSFTREEVARYSRHIALPDVGWRGQQRLRRARVLVVGAGGLGSPVALYLAAAGIGTIGLVDFDSVDLSNLQRQILYGTGDIGRPKLDAAVERLRATNPHVDLVRHDFRLTRDNALDTIAGYDVVVDGSDNFATRYLVNDACVLLRRPFVYGSILRFEGQVAVFAADDGPCYRCLFREPPPPGLVPDCAEGGVIGVLPGIIGSLQALETVKIILHAGDTLAGRIALFDALAFHWRELTLRRRPDCAVCGDQPTITALIDYDEFCGPGEQHMADGHANQVPAITTQELKRRLDAGDELLLIDVREQFEWDIANLDAYGARLIPLGDVPEHVAALPRDRDIIVHCRSGGRSAGAVRYLRAHGFDRVYNLDGGIQDWAHSIDPDMPTY